MIWAGVKEEGEELDLQSSSSLKRPNSPRGYCHILINFVSGAKFIRFNYSQNTELANRIRFTQRLSLGSPSKEIQDKSILAVCVENNISFSVF